MKGIRFTHMADVTLGPDPDGGGGRVQANYQAPIEGNRAQVRVREPLPLGTSTQVEVQRVSPPERICVLLSIVTSCDMQRPGAG